MVTGRVTDTGITLAPMIHAFGWAADDWDRLAAGIVAGHIIECGAQSTGGNFTDWREIPHFETHRLPDRRDARRRFVHRHQARRHRTVAVTVRTVKEQLVYEMGDPRAYITPDVVADFASAKLEQVGRNRVRVWGVVGRPAPPSLKISAAYADGWKASGTLIISGPGRCGKGPRVRATVLEAPGLGVRRHSSPSSSARPRAGDRSRREWTRPKCCCASACAIADRAKIEAFSKMLPAVILSGPPGVAVTGGRPQAQEVVAYWPALLPRELRAPRR